MRVLFGTFAKWVEIFSLKVNPFMHTVFHVHNFFRDISECYTTVDFWQARPSPFSISQNAAKALAALPPVAALKYRISKWASFQVWKFFHPQG